MPIDKQRVSVYSGTDTAYQQRITEGTIDENGVYFILSEPNNKIYVGTTLFGGGGSESSNIANFRHVIFHRTGSLLYDADPILGYPLSDLSTTNYLTGIITGVYLNGLRAVSELTITLEIVEFGGERYPNLTISPNHNYSDPLTELTVDIYLFEGETNLDTPETTLIEISDDQSD